METILILTGIALLQSPFIIKGGDSHTDKNSVYFFRRWISILLMSPLVFYKFYYLEVHMSILAWFILCFNLNLLFNFMVSLFYKQGAHQNSFQQVILQGQHLSVHVTNAVSLILYLVGYEIILRVILIDDLQSSGFSRTQALLISFIVYVLLHIPQGLKMTMGSVLFGIIATAWIFATGSVIPVIILHLACAFGNDYLLSRNSKSSIVKNSFSI